MDSGTLLLHKHVAPARLRAILYFSPRKKSSLI